MINRVIVEGRLTKDPVLRKTQNGASVVSYTIACNRRFKQDGQPEADFISCIAWKKTADVVAQYTQKGSLVGVEGRIQTRNYEDKDGKKVFVTEVITDNISLLESKKKAEAQAEESTMSFPSSDEININDEDLPF